VYRTRGRYPPSPPKIYGDETGLTCSEWYNFCSLEAFLRYRDLIIIAKNNNLALAA